jgi:heptosyltransferase-1
MIKKNIEKIAIVKLSAMGDIVHCMVVLQYIKKAYPNLKIDWFVEKTFAPLLQYNEDIHQVYEIHLKSLKKNKSKILQQVNLIKSYAKNNYDMVIDAQGLIKSALVCKLLGTHRVGFSKNSIRERFASFFYKQKVDIGYDKNVIVRNTTLFSHALDMAIEENDILNKKPFLFFKNEDKIIEEYLDKTQKNIVLVVGASFISKIYSKEKFAAIANALGENCLIVWGNEFERKTAQYIQEHSKAKVLPKIDLNTLKALISKADLVIGNDTGPTHIAWGLNRASITIFGSTPGKRNTFQTPINKIIESKSIVNPFKIDKTDVSINKIDEQEIINMAQELLK